MSYVDLHLHLLPGVDDGARDERESLEHATRMALEGVRDAVVTPHVGHPSFDLDVAAIPEHTRALQARLDRAAIPLRLRPGGEIHPSAAGRLSAVELDTIAQGPPGARWVLAEVPFAGIDDAFLDGCRAIRARGFAIVIAHPERAAGFLAGGLERLGEELAAGAVLQVNVCSLLGHHGADAQAGAERLVREGRAYVLASDGHAGTRRHTLRLGFELALTASASSVRAWQLTQANPRFLLRDGLPPERGAARLGEARPDRLDERAVRLEMRHRRGAGRL
jgi:protein-tyrosine phosphatase